MSETAIEILKAELQLRKIRNPNFSLRSFARWLNISPAQLSQMLTGKRTITLKTIQKISERLEYSPIEKSDLISKVTQTKILKAPSSKTLMADDQFQLISDWYHFAILSLTKIQGASADPRWIAQRLGISVNEASQALQRLERMGIIQTKPEFKQVIEPIEVLTTTPSAAIKKFHKQLLGLAQEKIETIPLDQRNFDALTIAINSQQLKFIKKQMNALMEMVLEQSQKDIEKKKADHVYQLNLQLFPLTKLRSSK